MLGIRSLTAWSACGVVGVALTASAALAQSEDYSELMALGDSALVDELDRRYQAGLAASLDNALIAADDPRYLWALETKTQCAIALGFMESSTRDATSIANCVEASNRMTEVPAPPAVTVIPPPQPPQQRPASCDDAIVGMVFFDFDSAELRPDSTAALNSVADNISVCGWSALSVVGHTDQAGTDAYNIGLSQERANAVAAALRSRSIGGVRIEVAARGESEPRVPLADGTRSPQNRRVEISAD
ncbi:OmpA family protein [Aurantiacibacter gilvus]|uniref:OmpA family protein n=1 Tax=Aurantiacibacter gilvus TaxID=3139141 RepID=A0ABU9IB51_9SPHN